MRKFIYLIISGIFLFTIPLVHTESDTGSDKNNPKPRPIATESTSGPGLSEAEEDKKTKDSKENEDREDWMPSDFIIKRPPPKVSEISRGISQGIQSRIKRGEKGDIGTRILSAAFKDIGKPYKLGGDGIRSTDCSMFTRMSMIRAGLADRNFVRSAGTQYRYSETGAYDMHLVRNFEPGDFLFFNWRNAFCARRYKGIGHVGFFIGPKKGSAMYIIHASSVGGKVMKDWVNTKYLVGIGRVIKR
jgi:cell wall-associated NlpC family hydrolase